MAYVAEEPIDTSDMIGLHGVFRRALSSAPALVASAADGATERAGIVGSFLDNVLRLLRAHHHGEDELVWPKLLERCPEEGAIVSRAETQHGEVVALIDQGLARIQAWTETGTTADAQALTTVLADLDAELTVHLDEEEAAVLPLCSHHMTAEEWAQLPEHGMRNFTGDKPWLVIGLIHDSMPPVGQARMMAAMPPPVSEMWQQFGQDSYAGFMADLDA